MCRLIAIPLCIYTKLMKRYLLILIKNILPVAVFLLTGLAAMGQASLAGKVTDSKTHAHIPGATIRIADLNLSANSDSLGHYQLKNIPAGYYLVEVEHTGYATKIRS